MQNSYVINSGGSRYSIIDFVAEKSSPKYGNSVHVVNMRDSIAILDQCSIGWVIPYSQ